MSNPYAPPEFESFEEVTLPPDTEFLFNDKCLAVTNRVELPRLCIVTAKSVPEKYERNSTLWWIPSLLRMPLIVTGVLLALTVVGFLGGLLQEIFDARVIVNSEFLARRLNEIRGVAILAAVFLSFIVLSLIFGRSVRATWSISGPEIRRYRIRQAAWTLVWTVAGVTLVISMSRSSVSVNGVGYVPFILALVAITTARTIRGPRPLRIIGKSDGLYLITGLSGAFLAELRGLVLRRSASQFHSKPATVASPESDIAGRGV